jgi:UDP-N-acetylmuramate dehydrogenase
MDKGIRGIVVNLNERFAKITRDGNFIKAQCGALMVDVSKFAGEASLTGLEFAVGIPGSIGGCIFMNAGAYDGEIKNVVHRVSAIDKEGNLVYYTNEEAQFSYRHSIFQDNDNLILEVELELQEGNQDEILAKMADLTNRRETKQPLEYPSAGSTFKRPPGYFAGTLIDQTGLKGLTVGGAQVSKKHAGFVVNIGGATAQNVLDLIAQVQQRVYEKHGVKLYPEVKMIGEQ